MEHASPPETAPSEALERILVAATALFAERGLNGVTTRELAAAVGLNIATVHYHAGNKDAIYKASLRRLDRLELELVTAFTTAFGRERSGTPQWLRGFLSDVIDAIVAFASAHPDVARLRVRQWLDPVDGVVDPQNDAMRPTWTILEDAFATARDAGLVGRDVDTLMFAHSFDWLIAGFYSGGVTVAQRRAPRTPAEIDAFRRYLKVYTLRMLGV